MTKANTMKAVRARAAGGPEVLEYVDVERPEPGEGEVLVKLDLIGVNYADIYRRQGSHHRETYPRILGQEGVGSVAALGVKATRMRKGDVVAFRGAKAGAYSEYAVVPESNLYKVPSALPAEAAVALQVQGLTAHYLANDVYRLKAGDSCLVHAGAGGVGHILIQLAKAKGARVLTTVGSAAKAERASRHGADEVILYRDENFAARVLELTDGKGVNVVYDGVGAATIPDSIAATAFLGMVATFGGSSGQAPPVDTTLLTPNCVCLTRVGLQRFIPDVDALIRRCDDLATMVESGKLRLDIAMPRPLSQAADVQRALESRSTTGKLIMQP